MTRAADNAEGGKGTMMGEDGGRERGDKTARHLLPSSVRRPGTAAELRACLIAPLRVQGRWGRRVGPHLPVLRCAALFVLSRA